MALIISDPTIFQLFWTKWALNPSGPPQLLESRLKTADSISFPVIAIIKSFDWEVVIVGRLIWNRGLISGVNKFDGARIDWSTEQKPH